MGKKTKFDMLLDILNGNNFSREVKNAAAKQIGLSIQEFSLDLFFILNKLYPILFSANHHSRVSASIAVSELIKVINESATRKNKNLWHTEREMKKISDFDINNIINNSSFQHLVKGDENDKIIDNNPIQDPDDVPDNICEVCQLAENLVPKMASKSWEQRHGAIFGLSECLKAFPSKNVELRSIYLEDIAYNILMLLSLDNFIDPSTNETVFFPVGNPACSLLGRILSDMTDYIRPVLMQFFQFINDEVNWRLPNFAWLIVGDIASRKFHVIDVDFIAEYIEKTLEQTGENLVDVKSHALNAILPFVEKLPNRNFISDKCWSLLLEMNDTSPYNEICLKILEKLLVHENIGNFLTIEAINNLEKIIGFPHSQTRKAAISLFGSIIDKHELPIWDDIDFKQFSVDVVSIFLREEVFKLEAKGLIVKLKPLIDHHGIIYSEDYIGELFKNIKEEDFNERTFYRNIFPCLFEISQLVEFPKETPPHFRVFGKNIITSSRLSIILCIIKGTERPSFYNISRDIFSSQPFIKTLMNFFNFSSDAARKFFNEMQNEENPDLRMFIGGTTGDKLNKARASEIIMEFVKGATENEFFIPSELNNGYYQYFMYENKELSRDIKLNADCFRILLRRAVYFPPKTFDSAETLLQTYFYIEAKQKLSKKQICSLVESMRLKSKILSSYSAFICYCYCVEYPSEFLPLFVEYLQKIPSLECSEAEFIDIFLTNNKKPVETYLVWISFFIRKLLDNIGSNDEKLRTYSSHALSQVVRLLPLEPPTYESKIPESLYELKAKSLKELAPLWNPDDMEFPEILPSNPTVPLNEYQKQGVKWLFFLEAMGLNGILADDMGLGKTLQSLCVVITSLHLRKISYNSELGPNPPKSLVLTLRNVDFHWLNEIHKFFPGAIDSCIIQKHKDNVKIVTKKNDDYVEELYTDKIKFYKFLNDFVGIIISQYDTLTKLDLDVYYDYIVLDEGHRIKNDKTNLALTVCKLKSRRRLILSGTPVQNKTTDIYNLFKFLMPGYLGPEKDFRKNFEGPITKMFDTSIKMNQKERDQLVITGQAALKKLHDQILPFILRRLKCDVMVSLQEKIILNEEVELVQSQEDLYIREFRERLDSNVLEKDDSKYQQRVHRERRFLIHPHLVLPDEPDVIERSSKLLALRDLLLRIGFDADDEDTLPSKVVIFCEKVEALEYICRLVLPSLPPSVQYCVIDSKNQSEEQTRDIIRSFNSDNGPDILVSRKEDASHGISLTAANIVILFELDWNPTVDQQAMDRVHRIGQKRQVTVYRMVVHNTIDSKILTEQINKMKIVDGLVGDNKSLKNIDATVVIDKQEDNTKKQDQIDKSVYDEKI